MAPKKKTEAITISPPNFQQVELVLRGTAPLMQAKFAAKAMQAMKDKMLAGSQAKKGTKRAPRDFESDFQQAIHYSEEGWIGVPASALRCACIDACRMAGFQMTRARMSIFVESDGLDATDGQPLIKLIAGEPEKTEMVCRNATGVADIRIRPMWRKWELKALIRFDADQFSSQDVVNLVARAGQQVGLGEGRPFSKSSNGMGFGTFEIV